MNIPPNKPSFGNMIPGMKKEAVSGKTAPSLKACCFWDACLMDDSKAAEQQSTVCEKLR